MKKLFSITELLKATLKVCLRFPLTVFFAILTAGILIYSVLFENFETVKEFFFPFTMGIPLFVALQCFTEMRNFTFKERWVTNMTGLVLWVGLYAFLKHGFSQSEPLAVYKVIVNLLILHLLVAALPFFKTHQTNGFWQFNKGMFLRVFITGIYAGVLFGGLSGALLACDKLLGIPVHEKAYAILGIVIAIVFTVIIFLSALPENIGELEGNVDYPKGLRIFVQFVLIPLVIIYLVILYGYTAKILIHWSLPEGIVTNLIMVFSVLGMLSLLLVHPYQNEEGQGWIKIYSRLYYWLIIPLIAVQFVAIGVRILDYGFTEPRLTVLILASWLLFVAVIQLVYKGTKIIIIPTSLAILAVLSLYSPVGVISFSQYSQEHRTLKMAQSIGLIQNGKLMPIKITAANKKAVRDFYEQAKYMIGHFSTTGLGNALVLKNQTDNQLDKVQWLDEELSKFGFDYNSISIDDSSVIEETIMVESNTSTLNIPAGKWSNSYMLNCSFNSDNECNDVVYSIKIDGITKSMIISTTTKDWKSDPIDLNTIFKWVHPVGNSYLTVANDKMIIPFKGKNEQCYLIVTSFNYIQHKNTVEFQDFKALLVRP